MNYLPFFIEDCLNPKAQESTQESLVEIKGSRARELINLHQLSEGIAIKSLLYNQSVGLAKILKVDQDILTFSYQVQQTQFSKNNLHLLVGLSRPQTIKKVLAAAQAFGVKSVQFLRSETSEKSYGSATIWKPENIQQELSLTMAQTGDPIAPVIKLVTDTSELTGISDMKCYLAEITSVVDLPTHPSSVTESLLAVGPEKGWSAKEKEFFAKNNFTQISFGLRTMRVEQAVLAGLGVLIAR